MTENIHVYHVQGRRSAICTKRFSPRKMSFLGIIILHWHGVLSVVKENVTSSMILILQTGHRSLVVILFFHKLPCKTVQDFLLSFPA